MYIQENQYWVCGKALSVLYCMECMKSFAISLSFFFPMPLFLYILIETPRGHYLCLYSPLSLDILNCSHCLKSTLHPPVTKSFAQSPLICLLSLPAPLRPPIKNPSNTSSPIFIRHFIPSNSSAPYDFLFGDGHDFKKASS